jgi:hypothetical protein
MGGSKAPSRDYGPPFDDADADTILRSADDLDFRVYRVILSKASPVFRDMFTFPHPGPSSCIKHEDDDDHKDGLPLVRLQESSMTLSMLLYAIYPVSPSHAPPPYAAQGRGEDDGALDTLTEAWLAADKYEVSGLREALTTRLQTHSLMARQPLRMFGVAYYLRSQTLLRTAAARTLPLAPLTLDTLGRQVDLVPFIAVRHLVEYHRACGEAARDFALLKADEDGFAEAFLPALLAQGSTSAPGRGAAAARAARVCKDSRCQFGNLRVPWPRLETLEWWRRYMEALSERLSERPAMSAMAAMGACTNEWESLASKLCARCRGFAASALVLAHTYLEEMLKVEIEEEVRIAMRGHRAQTDKLLPFDRFNSSTISAIWSLPCFRGDDSSDMFKASIYRNCDCGTEGGTDHVVQSRIHQIVGM